MKRKRYYINGLFWIVVPSKVDLSKVDPKTVTLIVMCASCVVVSTKLGTPPKIEERFLRHLEWWGCCGSPMILDYM